MSFDTFTIHNGRDRKIVRQLVRELEARRVRVWLDEKELAPGMPWQETLERVIGTVGSTVVCIGSSDVNPWQQEEMDAILKRFVIEKRPVIPVLLPGSKSRPVLPRLLRGFSWVDLREGVSKEGVDQLVWGITGRRPRS